MAGRNGPPASLCFPGMPDPKRTRPVSLADMPAWIEAKAICAPQWPPPCFYDPRLAGAQMSNFVMQHDHVRGRETWVIRPSAACTASLKRFMKVFRLGRRVTFFPFRNQGGLSTKAP